MNVHTKDQIRYIRYRKLLIVFFSYNKVSFCLTVMISLHYRKHVCNLVIFLKYLAVNHMYYFSKQS